MMDIINCVFRFFDFFVVIGLAVYYFNYYVVPQVEKMIREYSVFIYNLESDYKNLQLQVQSIQENIQDQDRHFQAMQEKFLVWKKKCDEKSILQQAKQEEIDQRIKESFILKTGFIERSAILKNELPEIMSIVKKKLHTQFSSSQAQKNYMHELIEVMKEKS